jgi:hypothetical protein
LLFQKIQSDSKNWGAQQAQQEIHGKFILMELAAIRSKKDARHDNQHTTY